jgi:ferric-dicitrate binding protein FerR (iron transport regulator)
MAVTSQSIPADLVGALRGGDEQAIERGFHQLYSTLVAEADAQLNDKASASRVAEKAFMQVMASPPPDLMALETALNQALHQIAVREQSRLGALKRFEHNEGVGHVGKREAADSKQAWAHIRETRARAAAGHHVDAKEDQHKSAAHMAAAMKERSRGGQVALIAGAIIVVALAGYGLTTMDSKPSEKFVLGQLNAATARAIGTPNGKVGNISLSDGTEMKIAAGSNIKTVANFGEKLRAVLVKGAASFSIAADKKPFELRGKDIAISATDGKIDIRADENRPGLVRIVAGTPSVTIGDSTWVAGPGQTYVADKGGIRAATPDEVEEAFAWMDNRFVVNGTLREITDGIRRWYDMDVGIGDNSIADWPAKATGTLDSVSSVIRSVEKSAKVRMQWQGRQMLLFRR